MDQERKNRDVTAQAAAASLEESFGGELQFAGAKLWDPQKPKASVRLLRAIIAVAAIALIVLSAIAHFSDRSQVEAAPVALQPLEAPSAVVLTADSAWRGSMTVTDYTGKRGIPRGETAVSARLMHSADGRIFFEIVKGDDLEDLSITPLLSMWVKLDGDTMEPLLDSEGVLFDLLLEPRDADGLRFVLRDGLLANDAYLYNDGSRSCTVQFVLSPLE